MATESKINEAISILLAAYPATGQKSTMGPFLALVTKTLQPYPNEVLAALVNPRSGIITECSFFPSIAELKIFCDRHHQKLLEVHYRDRQEEERRKALPPPPEDPRVREAIATGFRRLSQELGAPEKESLLTVEEEREKAERWLEQRAELAKTEPLPPLSPALRKILFGDQTDAK